MKKIVVCTSLIFLMFAANAGAAQFMDVTFDADTVGSAPAVGATSPITQIGSIGGYTATAHNNPITSENGTVVVDNVAGMSKAVVMTSNPANPIVGSLYLDTGMGIVSSEISFTFDISVLAAPPISTSQGGYHLDGSDETYGVLFGVRAYAGAWAFSFQVVPTTENGGFFVLRDATNTQVTSFGSYTEGQSYNIGLSVDYTTGKVAAYLDGALALSDYPSRTGAKPNPLTTTELFIYLNGDSGYTSQIALDNIKGFDTVIPEPATMSLLGLGALSLIRRKK